MVDWSALDTPADEIEAPKPLPAGDFTFTVASWDQGESSRKGTPFIVYYLKPTSPGDDVDEDMLEKVDWQSKQLRATFYLTQNAMFMLRNFLENACGLDIKGSTLKELIPEAIGAEVVGTVSVQEGNNGSFNPDVGQLRPAE